MIMFSIVVVVGRKTEQNRFMEYVAKQYFITSGFANANFSHYHIDGFDEGSITYPGQVIASVIGAGKSTDFEQKNDPYQISHLLQNFYPQEREN